MQCVIVAVTNSHEPRSRSSVDYDLEPGLELEVDGRRLRVREAVPRGHKLALIDLAAGTEVRKYGQPIGLATRDIAAGEHVHEHNLRSLARAGAPHAAEDAAEDAALARSAVPAAPLRSRMRRRSTASSAPTGGSGPGITSRSSARSTARRPWSSGSRPRSRPPVRSTSTRESTG